MADEIYQAVEMTVCFCASLKFIFFKLIYALLLATALLFACFSHTVGVI
jgi:hypothetical protein